MIRFLITAYIIGYVLVSVFFWYTKIDEYKGMKPHHSWLVIIRMIYDYFNNFGPKMGAQG